MSNVNSEKRRKHLENALQLALNKPNARVFRVDGNLTQVGEEAYANLLDIIHQLNKLGVGNYNLEKLDMFCNKCFLEQFGVNLYDREGTVENEAYDNHYEFIAHHRRRNPFYCKGKVKDYSHLVDK